MKDSSLSNNKTNLFTSFCPISHHESIKTGLSVRDNSDAVTAIITVMFCCGKVFRGVIYKMISLMCRPSAPASLIKKSLLIQTQSQSDQATLIHNLPAYCSLNNNRLNIGTSTPLFPFHPSDGRDALPSSLIFSHSSNDCPLPHTHTFSLLAAQHNHLRRNLPG